MEEPGPARPGSSPRVSVGSPALQPSVLQLLPLAASRPKLPQLQLPLPGSAPAITAPPLSPSKQLPLSAQVLQLQRAAPLVKYGSAKVLVQQVAPLQLMIRQEDEDEERLAELLSRCSQGQERGPLDPQLQ